MNMDEYPDGSHGQSGFPGELSTVGITSRLLILYPYHVKGLEMTCEGTVPYGPVQFEQKKLKVWVPLEAEIYPDVKESASTIATSTVISGYFPWIGPETGRCEVASAPIQESRIHMRDRVHRRASSLPVIN